MGDCLVKVNPLRFIALCIKRERVNMQVMCTAYIDRQLIKQASPICYYYYYAYYIYKKPSQMHRTCCTVQNLGQHTGEKLLTDLFHMAKLELLASL